MWTLAKKLKYFIDSFVAFSYVPVRACSLLGISLSLIGVLYAIGVVAMRWFFDIETEGWASLMVVILVVSGVLWRNLDETRRRPRFIVEHVIESREATRQTLPDHASPRFSHAA
jgi:dolichol-phosphate mannosyltransferase